MVDLDTLELIQRLHDFDVYDCTLAANRLEEQHRRLASKDAELNAAEDSHATEKRELLARIDTLETQLVGCEAFFQVLTHASKLACRRLDREEEMPQLILRGDADGE